MGNANFHHLPSPKSQEIERKGSSGSKALQLDIFKGFNDIKLIYFEGKSLKYPCREYIMCMVLYSFPEFQWMDETSPRHNGIILGCALIMVVLKADAQREFSLEKGGKKPLVVPVNDS